MQLKSLLFAAALFAPTLAITEQFSVWGAWVNGIYQGPGVNTYVRSPPPGNSSVTDVYSKALACGNGNANVARPRYVNVKKGDRFALEWYRHWRNDFYAGVHKGPVLVYIAPASSDINGPLPWTKIFQQAYVNGTWASSQFSLNGFGGHHVFTVPDLSPGKYLVRSEIIDLSNSTEGKAVFYPVCTQINITSEGTPAGPVLGRSSFPGTYEFMGLNWDVNRNDSEKYTPPGPATWGGLQIEGKVYPNRNWF